MVFDDAKKPELITLLTEQNGSLGGVSAVLVLQEEKGRVQMSRKQALRYTKKQMMDTYGEEADKVMKHKEDAGSAQDEDIAERPQKRGKKIPKDQATLTPLDKGPKVVVRDTPSIEYSWLHAWQDRLVQHRSPSHSPGREKIPNHSKLITRIFKDKSTEKHYGWVYVGSHNLTCAAWGTISRNEEEILWSNNRELGILLQAPSAAARAAAPAAAQNASVSAGFDISEMPWPFSFPLHRAELEEGDFQAESAENQDYHWSWWNSDDWLPSSGTAKGNWREQPSSTSSKTNYSSFACGSSSGFSSSKTSCTTCCSADAEAAQRFAGLRDALRSTGTAALNERLRAAGQKVFAAETIAALKARVDLEEMCLIINPRLPRQRWEVTHDLAMVRDAPSLGARAVARKDKGQIVESVEETFDGFLKLPDQAGWCAKDKDCQGKLGIGQLLKPLGSSRPVMASETLATSAGPQPFEVVFQPSVAVRSAPSTSANIISARRCGEVVLAETQTYDGWVRLHEDAGWMLSVPDMLSLQKISERSTTAQPGRHPQHGVLLQPAFEKTAQSASQAPFESEANIRPVSEGPDLEEQRTALDGLLHC
eukprot:g129.t1